MKKFVLLFIPLLVLTSCGNNPTDEFITAINDQHEKGKFFKIMIIIERVHLLTKKIIKYI